MTTKVERLRTALTNGEQLTARQIKARFRLANPRAAITSLRNKGLSITTNSSKNLNGKVGEKYRLLTTANLA